MLKTRAASFLFFTAIGALMALALSAGAATPPAPQKAPAKKSVAKSRPAAKKTVSAAHKSTSSSTRTTAPTAHKIAPTTARTAAARKKALAHRTTWRNRQTAPSPDRYKEIQNALVSKGYLAPGEVTGTWGPSSTEALKKFQSDQNIGSTGKLNSLSLIALGLGPKHDSVTPAKPAGGGAGQ